MILVSCDVYGDYLISDVRRLLSQTYPTEDIVVCCHTLHWVAVAGARENEELTGHC